MNIEEQIQALRELMGGELSQEELDQIFQESPELKDSAISLRQRLGSLRDVPVPELPVDFTARVVSRLSESQPAAKPRKAWFSVPRLALGAALAAILSLALWRVFPWEPRLGPPLSVREALGPEGQKVYFVRFALKESGAKQVAVAGDFNQWMPMELGQDRDESGNFSVEIPLEAGTYSYSFLVDGKKWLADPAADRVVDDGFGKKNSVINL